MTALNGKDLTRVFEIRSEAAGVAVKCTIENTAFLNGFANVAGFHGAGLRSNCAGGGTINLYYQKVSF